MKMQPRYAEQLRTEMLHGPGKLRASVTDWSGSRLASTTRIGSWRDEQLESGSRNNPESSRVRVAQGTYGAVAMLAVQRRPNCPASGADAGCAWATAGME